MNDVNIVVGTLDLYHMTWPPMCHGLQKYWPDCPWPVYFITNRLAPPHFQAIKTGKPADWAQKRGWSGRMRHGIKKLAAPVILWLTEDNWLTAPPDTGAVQDFANHILKGRADHIRLYPGWDHDQAKAVCPYDDRLLIFTEKSPYRCSLKPGLWDRKIFLDLLRDGESSWDHERQAGRRSRQYRDRFLAIKEWGGFFPVVVGGDPSGDWVKSPVVCGRWTISAQRYAEREGLTIDFSKHPLPTITDPKLRTVDWVLP